NPESRKKPARSTTAKPATAKKSPKQQKNNIIVRLARVEDIEACRAIGRALHEKTIFAHIPWSDKKFDRQCDELLKLPPSKAGLVAELDGRVLGFVYLSCGEYFFGEGHVITTVQVLAVDSDNLGAKMTLRSFTSLIKGAKEWAATRGPDGNDVMVLVNVTTGIKLRG
ncbi:MAG: hypothetical protein GY742_10090, partial [Hyphomicrobiales bacterium]|nr:hypothetical protein [Hyphomicrobiales bacterium]